MVDTGTGFPTVVTDDASVETATVVTTLVTGVTVACAHI